jgi:hypothetical protein
VAGPGCLWARALVRAGLPDRWPPPQSWQQITSQERFPIHAVGQYPPLGWSRQDLFAAGSKQLSASLPPVCAIVVYLRTGPNEYHAYGLLGGP